MICVLSEKHSSSKTLIIMLRLQVNQYELELGAYNTGDSRCILVSITGEITELSHDHKPNNMNERNRIQSDGTWRVEGVLAVSRSFGDRLLKRWIIPDPEVIAHKINNKNDLFGILFQIKKRHDVLLNVGIIHKHQFYH